MKKNRIAAGLTGIVLLAALGVSVARNNGWTLRDLRPAAVIARLQPKPAAPEDAIYAMLDAARLGDSSAYLACYTGHIQASLQQSAREAGAAGFLKYLRDSDAAIQGVAINAPEPIDAGRVKARVEYVYRDKNEVQFVYLTRDGSRWRIYQVDSAEKIKTLVPYGSAVTD
jgi:hypothetical protein